MGEKIAGKVLLHRGANTIASHRAPRPICSVIAIGGGGGGRADVAQAGGRDAAKLDDALALVAGLVKETAGA